MELWSNQGRTLKTFAGELRRFFFFSLCINFLERPWQMPFFHDQKRDTDGCQASHLLLGLISEANEGYWNPLWETES